jgi:hypothetical protein
LIFLASWEWLSLLLAGPSPGIPCTCIKTRTCNSDPSMSAVKLGAQPRSPLNWCMCFFLDSTVLRVWFLADSDQDSQIAKRATIILLIVLQVYLLLFHFVAWLAISFFQFRVREHSMNLINLDSHIIQYDKRRQRGSDLYVLRSDHMFSCSPKCSITWNWNASGTCMSEHSMYTWFRLVVFYSIVSFAEHRCSWMRIQGW